MKKVEFRFSCQGNKIVCCEKRKNKNKQSDDSLDGISNIHKHAFCCCCCSPKEKSPSPPILELPDQIVSSTTTE